MSERRNGVLEYGCAQVRRHSGPLTYGDYFASCFFPSFLLCTVQYVTPVQYISPVEFYYPFQSS